MFTEVLYNFDIVLFNVKFLSKLKVRVCKLFFFRTDLLIYANQKISVHEN